LEDFIEYYYVAGPLQYFNSLMPFQEGKNSDSESEMQNIRIRDRHPGSATLEYFREKTTVRVFVRKFPIQHEKECGAASPPAASVSRRW
jgi:hypothetical protein